MRLTGGEARGRRLKGPRGLPLRPTSDRVREALFDILGARVDGALFLDAYAGTGAVGVEALSRGARGVVFLERDRRARGLIAENLRVGAWAGAAEVRGGDVAASIAGLARSGARFDIVFLDPPYDRPAPPEVLDGGLGITAPGGVMVIEHRVARPPALRPGAGPPTRRRTYRYGDTALTLVRPEAASS